jgi:hypothetical protein
MEIIGKDRNTLQDLLKEVLFYNKDTGKLTWKVVKSFNIKIGDEAGCIDTSTGYRKIRINNKLYYSHRLAWLYHFGIFPKNKIDHINGIRDDNRIENLRDVSDSENAQNQRVAMCTNKLGILGVCKHRGRFRATIKTNDVQTFLGYFDTPEKAYMAYLEAKRELHITCEI